MTSEVRVGELTNGLHYFIRRNQLPAGQLALRLAVQAGSIDEDEDQRGLAHLLEHMAFNGTDRFEAGELVAYMESIGVRFGPHANAYTSFDETVYILDVPVERDGAIVRAFEALSDFAGGMTLDTSEIDRERGVVIEEWRGRQGAGTRLQDQQLPAIFGDSRYARRLPIGLPEVLQTFPAERLVDFYREHYRADRMAVIAVGDIDPDEIESLITRFFGSLAGTTGAERQRYEVPLHRETLIVAAADPETQGNSVSVLFKRPFENMRTVGDYRSSVVQSLVSSMLNARFGELAQSPDAPFLRATARSQSIGGEVEAFTLSASVEVDGLTTGLTALGTEMARVDQHAFGDVELDRAKRSLLVAYERSYAERDRTQNSPLANELVRHFIEGEPVPGIEVEYQIVQEVLPGIAVEEVIAFARNLFPEEGRVVLATATGLAGEPPAGEAELLAALRVGEVTTVEAWDDGEDDVVLLASLPEPGRVIARRELPDLGVTIVTLSNGVEAWLKPTDFRNNEVIFTGYARGGSSLADLDDYRNATLSTALMDLSGVGGFTPVELRRLLTGHTANVSANVSTYTHGVSGSATSRDLELALQLLYLRFTAVNHDDTAFALLTRQLEASLANRDDSPAAVFRERVRQVNTSDHPTSRAMGLEDVANLSVDQMRFHYESRFANAADFTFFFVGAFDIDTVIPLLESYLGSLPSTGLAMSASGALGLEFPNSIEREVVRKGREPQSQTVMSFFADTGLEELEMHRLRAATTVLEIRLRDLLREELGGTYSVGVGYSNNQPEFGYGRTTVQFGSAPERAGDLVEAVLLEIKRLQQEGPSEEDVERVRETEKRGLSEALRENSYWLGSLQIVHLLGWDPGRILRRIDRAESLSTENVHAAFRRYFPADRYTVVTLLPEE
jgi:zinc protease